MDHKKGPVLITGGSGYIGTAIIERLRNDYHIIVLDNEKPQKKYNDVEFKNLNITVKDDIYQVLDEIKRERGETIYSIIHLAGYYNFNGEENALYEEVNVNGTKHLLQKLYDDFDVGQFIFSSSMLVYRPAEPGEKITEESEFDPEAWAYPASKIRCEEIIAKFHGRIPFVILRIAAVYNDYGYAPSIAQQILRIHEMHLTSFMFPGDRTHRRSTLHVDDLAEVVSLLIGKRDKLPDELILSVAEDEAPDFETLQNEISQHLFQRKLPLLNIPKPFAKAGAWVLDNLPGRRQSFIKPWMIRYSDANYDIDNSKIKKLLDWKPKRNIKQSLPLIISNLMNYPGTWYRINKIPRPPVPSMVRTKFMKQILPSRSSL